MVQVTFVEAGGPSHVVSAHAGQTLMETAIRNNVDGIIADCGGSAVCGTCRVFVDSGWQLEVGGPNEMEAAMLELCEGEPGGRRLSCQVTVTEMMEGLIVRLPKSQF
jgi:ferredoxin, 2Fe-2S